MFQIFSGFWKTLDNLGDAYDPSNSTSVGLNRTPHNIAFGALFFWLPFVVLLTAHVGGSQTSHMIPKVLEDLRQYFEDSYDLSKSVTREAISKTECETFPELSFEENKRRSHGGLPVWQTEKFNDFRKPDHRSFAWGAMLFSFGVLLIPTACAITLSWRTPTEGFGCRAMTQLSFLMMWIISTCADGLLFLFAEPPSHELKRAWRRTGLKSSTVYWITFAKDFIITVGMVATLTWTALGAFNKCECWSKWPKSTGYISFLQDDYVFHIIRNRLNMEFPVIVGGALLFQIVLFVGVWFYFREGHRVLKQRDIDSVLHPEKSVRYRLWLRLRSFFPLKSVMTSTKWSPMHWMQRGRNSRDSNLKSYVAYHSAKTASEQGSS